VAVVARIRSLEATDGDIARADVVLRAAFATERSFEPRLRRYLAVQPDGWLAAEEDGQLVGTVGVIDYGALAYVGLMAVRPDRQGRSIGRQLLGSALDWIAGRGIDCALLDASEDGARLYPRMGFVDAGPTQEFHRAASSGGAPPASHLPGVASAAGAAAGVAADGAELSELVALDRRLFGADRERLWRRLLTEYPGRTLVVRDPGGQMAGYLCVQGQTLGPWGAVTPDAARCLLDAALPLGAPGARVLMPGQNSAGGALLAARGWAARRSLRHMRRGPEPDLKGWRSIYGKGSFCVG
jgi:GNAT superfamily N-acetyltransferase